jgi:hypothetical protein
MMPERNARVCPRRYGARGTVRTPRQTQAEIDVLIVREGTQRELAGVSLYHWGSSAQKLSRSRPSTADLNGIDGSLRSGLVVLACATVPIVG